jgi:hypothetical protein
MVQSYSPSRLPSILLTPQEDEHIRLQQSPLIVSI